MFTAGDKVKYEGFKPGTVLKVETWESGENMVLIRNQYNLEFWFDEATLTLAD